MGSLILLLFALLVAEFSHGLPLKPSTAFKPLPSQDLDGVLARRGVEGQTYQTDYAYVFVTKAKEPTTHKIARIINKVVTAPQKVYNKNIKNGQWRETVKKGELILAGQREKVKEKLKAKINAMKGKKPKGSASTIDSLIDTAIIRQHLSKTDPYPPFHAEDARLETPTSRLRDLATFRRANSYPPNHKFAPSAPPEPLDPSIPFYRRSLNSSP